MTQAMMALHCHNAHVFYSFTRDAHIHSVCKSAADSILNSALLSQASLSWGVNGNSIPIEGMCVPFDATGGSKHH